MMKIADFLISILLDIGLSIDYFLPMIGYDMSFLYLYKP
ncbi:hypothetical protein B6N60_04700 [Richelia sinica FACHB-800]|uniref:Uncharacterized protein n=1 Tax=Richelia sinica FACHB-800 TaxID=1357546 RepID=A0A975Y753_9NOST|nr:hypothetical protein B6N60_04700 [Richelia sinica FACHB-800]